MRKIFLHVSVGAFVFVLTSGSVHAQVDAVCAPEYNNQFFEQQPELSPVLCTSGTPSQTMEGDGSTDLPWKWHCFDEAGNQGEQCLAFKGQASTCGNGIVEAEEQCDGHAGCSDSCTMQAQCETSVNGQYLEVLPEDIQTLCSVGTTSNVILGTGTQEDPWTWSCYDVAGTPDETCSAYEGVAPTADVDESTESAEPVVETSNTESAASGSTSEAEAAEAAEVAEDNAAQAAPVAVCDVADYSDIEGRIWHDEDQDGSTSSEDGIEDVTVELYDADGNEIAEDKTNDDGEFEFKDLAPGKYTVDVKQSDKDLDGYHLVHEEDNNLNGRDQLKLDCDDDYDDARFGYDNDARESAGDRPSSLSQTGGLWGMIRVMLGL